MSSQFQDLTQQFNVLLTEYKETYENYINTLNSKNNSFQQVPTSSYIGESNLSVLNNSSVDACQTECTLNTNCTGATFNTTSNTCKLATGNGEIIYNANATAIVKNLLYYSTHLKDLNQQMIVLNEQMMTLSNNNYEQYNENQTISKQQDQIVQNNYNVLLDERLEIEKLSRQYQTLNAAYDDGNLIVNANYSKYIVFLLITILLVILLLRTFLSGLQRGGGSNFVNTSKKVNALFGILCFIILIIQIFKK